MLDDNIWRGFRWNRYSRNAWPKQIWKFGEYWRIFTVMGNIDFSQSNDDEKFYVWAIIRSVQQCPFVDDVRCLTPGDSGGNIWEYLRMFGNIHQDVQISDNELTTCWISCSTYKNSKTTTPPIKLIQLIRKSSREVTRVFDALRLTRYLGQ